MGRGEDTGAGFPVGPLGLYVGQRARRTQTVTAREVELYAQITGDRNKVGLTRFHHLEIAAVTFRLVNQVQPLVVIESFGPVRLQSSGFGLGFRIAVNDETDRLGLRRSRPQLSRIAFAALLNRVFIFGA